MHRISKLFIALLCLSFGLPPVAQQTHWQLRSESGYTLAIRSELAPLELNRMHSWELVLNQPDGSPVSDAQITMQGGMPLHDHGLPTEPRISTGATAGSYLLEGMRFHMPGLWQLVFTINHGGNTETIQLDFEL